MSEGSTAAAIGRATAPTVWADGRIAGVWDVLEEPPGTIGAYTPGREGTRVGAHVARFGAALGAWIAGASPRRTVVMEVAEMIP